MTLTNALLTSDEAVEWTGQNASRPSDELDDFVNAATRMVEELTGRHFYQTTGARLFEAECARELELGPYNDLVSISALKVDQDGDGVFETTISAANYQLEPVNAAVFGRPYTEICLLNSAYFPMQAGTGRDHLVEVTGTWGWPSVPDGPKAATRLLLGELVKLKDAPLGIAGSPDFGVSYVRSNLPARVRDLLASYIHPLWFGLA